MNPIVRVGFSTSDSVLSKIIRFGAGGPASHAFLQWYDERWAANVILGEDSGGWRYQAEDAWLNDGNQLVGLYELTGVDLWVGLARNAQLLGAGYDWSGLLGMVPEEIERLLGKRLRENPAQDPKHWFCSEIVRKVIEDSSVALDLPMSRGATDPDALMRAVAALPFAVSCIGEHSQACPFPRTGT